MTDPAPPLKSDAAPAGGEVDLARCIAARIGTDPRSFGTAAALAKAAGISLETLGDVVRRHYHASPDAIMIRESIAAAAAMLRGRERSISDVAAATGFASAAALGKAFSREMAMTPGDYRSISTDFVIDLPRGYVPGVALRYMSRDPESPSERGTPGGFVKAMLLDGKPSVMEMRLEARAARCCIHGVSSVKACVEAHRAALRLLGLPFDTRPFETKLMADRRLAPLIAAHRGLRIPLSATVFESLVWAIVGQQVNLAFAYKLRRVVIELAGARAGTMRAHPAPADVARLDYADLTSRQFSRRKAEYLIDTARLVATGDLDAEAFTRDSAVAVEQRLLATRGFGAWSTNYVMMRGCGFADCVPLGDTGLATSLREFFDLDERPDRETTLALMEHFAPFRSLATLHLWMRLSHNAM